MQQYRGGFNMDQLDLDGRLNGASGESEEESGQVDGDDDGFEDDYFEDDFVGEDGN